jgi:hypothetical protein
MRELVGMLLTAGCDELEPVHVTATLSGRSKTGSTAT